ncbi:MAG: mechanosensitive ion channel family protein, partial [bacterium]
LIERKLPKETDALAALEGEGGGAGATRAETLLPLMRTTLTVVLITFVLLSVLHTLGIAITPLLAGAGVVGIAIGFGAQKLVQDVLSGIFFLVDDAFRKSEYIEIENLRGTVEKISLRSMQLRHHLGAVQTIPYGEIKTVKNLSRDWITMKLELRLSYDTDIEQVRKIIKKVGQSMLEDPELGPSFILPLKSQGVMRVEESALIVRMKFTTKPGEQWVVRREAYRKVRDALADAGIFFAHREVRVRLPDDMSLNGLPDKTEAVKDTLAKAGAAAGTIEAQDAQKRGKMDFDDDM